MRSFEEQASVVVHDDPSSAFRLIGPGCARPILVGVHFAFGAVISVALDVNISVPFGAHFDLVSFLRYYMRFVKSCHSRRLCKRRVFLSQIFF